MNSPTMRRARAALEALAAAPTQNQYSRAAQRALDAVHSHPPTDTEQNPMKLSAIVKNLCDTINEQGPKKASWAVAALATLGSPEAPAAYDEKRAKQRARMGLGVEEKPAPKGTTHYSAVAHVAAYNRKGGQ